MRQLVRTQICITIDTEFSIAGAFADPDRRRPMGEENVTCPIGGGEQGLGFLLGTFNDYGVPATFFVETLQSAYFGDAPMGRMVERLLTAGQDVQLHVHPCWRTFSRADWRETLPADKAPNDNCDGMDVAELHDTITEASRALTRIGVADIVAMRTGNLRADRGVYRAQAACGIPVASNIGVALNRPSDADLCLAGGRHRIEGVLEVPVLTYTQLELGPRRFDRLLTTTATSAAETEGLLWQAHRAGVPTIVLLTHPFEFIKGDRLRPEHQRINRVNQGRLRRLCAFIAANPQSFEAVSFAGAAPGWLAKPDVPAPDLRAPLLPVLARMATNRANDLVPAL